MLNLVWRSRFERAIDGAIKEALATGSIDDSRRVELGKMILSAIIAAMKGNDK